MIKKILPYLFFAISLISCVKQRKSAVTESATAQKTETTIKAAIDFGSNPIARQYKTIIVEKYNELNVNFASHYIIVTWGCGSGCVTGAMVDTRDGFVYSMPDDNEWGGNGTYIESKKESEILLTVLVVQSPTRELEETRKYWEWDEELKEFRFNKLESIISNQKD